MLGGLVLASVPLWISRVGLYPYLGVEILIWSIYALAFNLLLGTAGLPSFGHGAYFGIGAYAFGLAQFNLAPNLWLCLAAALLAGGLAGALVALFISHRRGIYYAFMTIAFGQIFWFIAIKSHAITGGEDGLLKIARLPADFGFVSFDLAEQHRALLLRASPSSSLAAVAPVAADAFAVRARALGDPPERDPRRPSRLPGAGSTNSRVFTLSAALSGFAGGLFAMAQNSAFPDVMSLHYSGYIVMMVLVGGGMVSFWGPVVGVVVFLVARDVIGAYTTSWMLWFGLLFIAVVLFRPEGIAGAVQGWWRQLDPRRLRGAAAPLAGAEGLTPWRCSRPATSMSASATAWCSRISASRSSPARCTASWARTAPARRPSSTC